LPERQRVEGLPPRCIIGRTTALEDLWLEVSSRPGCAEVIDMGHAGSVREERRINGGEPMPAVRELSHMNCEGSSTEYPDREHS
jgi:hypothetical protein